MSSALPRGRDSPPHWNQPARPLADGHLPRAQSPSIRSSQPGPPPHYANYPQPPPPPPQQQQQQQQQAYPAHSPYQQHPPGQAPPPQSQHPGEMLTLPPPPQVHQDMYRQQHAPPPPSHYDPYAQQAPPPMGYPQQPQQSAVTFNQPAPRQRTAIACRYCRRRKIRCHGFDQNPEGRCSNCVRFNQECIFTPVSSQTHAFVPAHTAYPHLRNQGRMPQTSDGRPLYPQQGGPPLYGAHGQPLSAVPPPSHSDAHYPPPPNPHQPYGAPAPYPTAPPSYDGRVPPHHAPPHDDQVSSKRQRTTDDGAYAPPRLAIQLSPLSPPYSESPVSLGAQNRRSSGYEHYPDPNHMTPISPASTTASYQNQNQPYQGGYYAQPHHGQQLGPAQQPTPSTQHRTSPTSNYSFEARRESASPHGSVSAGPGNSSYGGPYPGNLHPPQVLPPANDVRNPSPAGQPRENGRSNGMRVHDMLDNSDPQGGRSNTDSNMLNRLNKRAP